MLRLVLLVLAALLAPAAAGAATSAARAHTTSPRAHVAGLRSDPSATTSSGQPAQGSLRLYLPDAFFVHGEPVTIPGRGLHVDGVVHPFVAGQWVTVRAFLGRRLVKTDRLRIRRSRNGGYGRFSEYLSSPGVGEMTVLVRHQSTSLLGPMRAHRRFAALAKNVGFGATGRFVQLLQQRLAALAIYTPQSGVFDGGTGLALDAYHRLLGWGTAQTLDARTVSFLLDGFGHFKVHDPRGGKHAEGDLRHQLLALIDGSKVYRIYPISSGKPSTPTVLGHFRVYRRDPGYLPDGMYDSSFFYTGYAIHGYDPAPDYPASHGCMRLPITDAASVFDWLSFGDVVDVY
ncbi:MAG: L,D-transpeptidase [Solirubrobacteraceae bacterium]